MVLQSDQALSLSQAVESLCRWDSYHYKNLAELGYSGYMENGQHLFLVFYPGVRVAAAGGEAGPSPHLRRRDPPFLPVLFRGLRVPVQAVQALRRPRRGPGTPCCCFASTPFPSTFGEPMTEGLFLLTTGGALYSAARGKWLSFALWGLAACLTRMTGLLVLVPRGVGAPSPGTAPGPARWGPLS